MRAGLLFVVNLAFVALSVTAHAQPTPCVDDATRNLMRTTMMDALDQALKAHIARLFDGWMRDASQQPQRAGAGFDEAMRAYIYSRQAAMNWQPPRC